VDLVAALSSANVQVGGVDGLDPIDAPGPVDVHVDAFAVLESVDVPFGEADVLEPVDGLA
jgi:hypothetical protein